MPKIELPESLKPYTSHGLDLNLSPRSKEALGDCPLCSREGRFSVNSETGLWRCLKCDERGNPLGFVRRLWEISYEATTTEDYKEFAVQRKLLYPDTLLHWGLAKSVITREWLAPGYGSNLAVAQVYRYINTGKRWLWMATSSLGHGFFASSPSSLKDCNRVYILEGIWDGAAFWEVARQTKETEDGYAPTANVSGSLLGDAFVMALPAATVFPDSWLPLIEDKQVNLVGQNDHERTHPKTGKRVEPASWNGMRRIANLLDHPESLRVLYWGDGGYTKELPSGYDIRDLFTS